MYEYMPWGQRIHCHGDCFPNKPRVMHWQRFSRKTNVATNNFRDQFTAVFEYIHEFSCRMTAVLTVIFLYWAYPYAVEPIDDGDSLSEDDSSRRKNRIKNSEKLEIKALIKTSLVKYWRTQCSMKAEERSTAWFQTSRTTNCLALNLSLYYDLNR